MSSRAPSSVEEVERAFDAVKGRPLAAVFYRRLEGEEHSAYRTERADFDADLQAVILQFESCHFPVTITWAIEDVLDGLHVALRRDVGLRSSLPTVDASSLPGWSEIIGKPLEHAASATYEADGERITWSLRLTSGGRSLVIALGGTDVSSTRLTYEADELVVIFEERVARSFRPPSGGDPAWGDADR